MDNKDGYLICIVVLCFIVFMLFIFVGVQGNTIKELSMYDNRCHCECCSPTPTIVE